MDPERDEELEAPAQNQEVTPDQKQSPDWYKVKPSPLTEKPDLFVKNVTAKAAEEAKSVVSLEIIEKNLWNSLVGEIEPYTSAIDVRTQEIIRGDFDDSENFEPIKEITTKREGFLGLKKSEVTEYLGAKWVDHDEAKGLTKYSRIDCPKGLEQSTKFSMLIAEDGKEQPEAYPLVEISTRNPEFISLKWSPNTSEFVRKIITSSNESSNFFDMVEGYSKKTSAQEYAIRLSIDPDQTYHFKPILIFTAIDKIIDAERQLQKDLPTAARYHEKRFLFDVNTNQFTSDGHFPMSINPEQVVGFTKALLSTIPIEKHPLNNSQSVSTFPVPK